MRSGVKKGESISKVSRIFEETRYHNYKRVTPKHNPLRWSKFEQWFKMKEIFHTYLKKSGRFVGGTLTGFFGMLTMIVIPNFVENYNLMITLEVFIFSIWFGIIFYRNQLLKNSENE